MRLKLLLGIRCNGNNDCTLDDLSISLGHHISEINKYLDVLENEEIITRMEEKRGTFYQLNNKGIDEKA